MSVLDLTDEQSAFVEAIRDFADREVGTREKRAAATNGSGTHSAEVAKKMADPGTMIAAGTPLFTVVDDSVLELRAAVPSASYGAVTEFTYVPAMPKPSPRSAKLSELRNGWKNKRAATS